MSQDRSEVLLNVVTLDTQCNPATYYVYLKGLDADAEYRMEEDGGVYTGAALMYAGLPIPRMKNEYEAWQVHFVRV